MRQRNALCFEGRSEILQPFRLLLRPLALRAKGRRFKSGSAHHLQFSVVESEVFAGLHVENCVIRCFRWFPNVLLRLKPRVFDFSTSSLSKYNTTFRLFDITNASAGMRGEVLCYKFGHCSLIVKT